MPVTLCAAETGGAKVGASCERNERRFDHKVSQELAQPSVSAVSAGSGKSRVSIKNADRAQLPSSLAPAWPHGDCHPSSKRPSSISNGFFNSGQVVKFTRSSSASVSVPRPMRPNQRAISFGHAASSMKPRGMIGASIRLISVRNEMREMRLTADLVMVHLSTISAIECAVGPGHRQMPHPDRKESTQLGPFG